MGYFLPTSLVSRLRGTHESKLLVVPIIYMSPSCDASRAAEPRRVRGLSHLVETKRRR
jgi:hypothetical protein